MSRNIQAGIHTVMTILALSVIVWFITISMQPDPYKACKVVERLEDSYVLSCGFDDGFPQGYFDEKE